MGREAIVYLYTCDRCGRQWQVDQPEVTPDTDLLARMDSTREQGGWPHKVEFPGIHDGGGGRTKDSRWEVCTPCFRTIRNNDTAGGDA